jgi:hypothetical protein
MAVRLDLRQNLGQFALLVVVNAFVGAMVGLERSILPAIAEQEFQLAARTAVLSFIVVFGVAKALTNYGAGRLSDHVGRKHGRGVARRRSRAVPLDVGADVELGAGGESTARHQPGSDVVHDVCRDTHEHRADRIPKVTPEAISAALWLTRPERRVILAAIRRDA